MALVKLVNNSTKKFDEEVSVWCLASDVNILYKKKMSEENFDIYGDLDNFEFCEKLKEKDDEIACLTARLHKSVERITDLENKIQVSRKKHKTLLKNTSSLLLTSKLEVNRKIDEINLLKQRLENKTFRRRPNSSSVEVQTDFSLYPSFKPDDNIQKKKYVPRIPEVRIVNERIKPIYIEQTSPINYHRSAVVKPYQNPFARQVSSIDEAAEIGQDCYRKSLEKNDDNTKLNDRRDYHKDGRKHSFAATIQYNKEGAPQINDGKEDKQRNRDHKSHRRSKDSNHRCGKIFRFDSERKDHHSRSKSKHRKRSRSKSRNRKRSRSNSGDRNQTRSKSKIEKTDNYKPAEDPQKLINKKNPDKSQRDINKHLPQKRELNKSSEIVNKDLEAVLASKIKILQEIESVNKIDENPGNKENLPEEQRNQQKLCSNDTSDSIQQQNKMSSVDEQQNHHHLHTLCTKNVFRDASDIAEEKISIAPSTCDISTVRAETSSATLTEVNNLPQNSEGNNVSSVNEAKAPIAPIPVLDAESNPNEIRPNKIISPTKESSKLVIDDSKEIDVSKEIHTNVNENSNSQMDIDYELTKVPAAVNEFQPLASKETSTDGHHNTITSKEKLTETISFDIHETTGKNDNQDKDDLKLCKDTSSVSLVDSSCKRRILSRRSEYTVHEVGNEIHLYITRKKRKKPKKDGYIERALVSI